LRGLGEIRVGIADADSGINGASLSITADFTVEGRAPGTELHSLATLVDDGIYAIALGTPMQSASDAHLFVQVADNQGNITRVARKFSVGPAGSRTATPTPLNTATRAPARATTGWAPTATCCSRWKTRTRWRSSPITLTPRQRFFWA
jgi:hypothetical protein